ncbi:MAG: M24 family metallopeptidase [Actinomycetota bacterium]|nr:M24 family metallopeptidase [Actinomycetota bacterium]
MTTYLLYDDAVRSPEMRHELGKAIGDDVLFFEHDGRGIVVGSVLEAAIFEGRDDIEFWSSADLGSRELIADKLFPEGLIHPEIARRALEKLGSPAVTVPATFRVSAADYLRDHDIDVIVDQDAWQMRRRAKSASELEGINRAQGAAESAMQVASRMLRESTSGGNGILVFEGATLTAEIIRAAMVDELLRCGAESEDILVHSGDACLRGHDLGSGPILKDQSCIIDCFPRDRASGCFSDLTRTFVPGTPSAELTALHGHCLRALEIALESVKVGTAEAHARVTEYFHLNGYPTGDHHDGPKPLTEGFFHGLGHGVGLQVHEKPWIGRRADAFVSGDVIALEPGLYFAGVGGVRLEDTVVITDDGCRHLAAPLSYGLAP